MKKLLGMLTAAFLATMMFAGAAGASVVVTPNPIPVADNQSAVTTTVNFAQPPANQYTFISQCKLDPADANFDATVDCSNYTTIQLNPNPTSLTYQFSVFRGVEPSGDQTWGCFKPGETVPAGITGYTQCWIRVAYNTVTNNGNDEFTPFTFTGAPIPEAPVVLLLPVFAILVLGGGVFMQRRRNQAALTV